MFILAALTTASIFFSIVSYRRTRYLQREIERRKKAEERVSLFNFAMLSICNIYQLIARVRDQGKLLRGICEKFSKIRGFNSTGIILVDEKGNFATALQAGEDRGGFSAMRERLKGGEMTQCIRQSLLQQSGVIMLTNPAVECSDCSLIGKCAGQAWIIACLKYEGRVYGFR